MKTQVLARDSLKNQKSQMFTTLYDLILFVVIPMAFELSFVKIFQKSMNAYHVNDVVALSRLIVYFLVQYLLGVMVRKHYVSTTLKRLTLAIMILIQVKEAFFDEVLFDMMVSMIMESGLAMLLFVKFTQFVILINMIGLAWLISRGILFLVQFRNFNPAFNLVGIASMDSGTSKFRIHNCMKNSYWYMPYHC